MLYPILILLNILLTLSCLPHQVTTSEISSDERIIPEWQNRNRLLTGLSARAKILLSTPEHAKSFTVLYSASIPQRFRIEVVTPFGQTIAVLSTDGSKIYAINLNENICFSSDLDKVNISKFVPFVVAPVIITDLLITRIPFFDNSIPILNSEDDNELAFSYENGGEIYTVYFSKAGSLKIMGAIDDLTYSYDKFFRAAGILVPREITITNGSSYARIEIRDAELNPTLELADFILEIPEGCELTEGGIF